MRIVFVNGSDLTLTWHEFRAALWHPLFVALVLVMVAIIVVLSPYDGFLGLNPLEKTLFHANGVISFMALLVAAIAVLQWGPGGAYSGGSCHCSGRCQPVGHVVRGLAWRA